MQITEPQRATLEDALDRLFLLASKAPAYRAGDATRFERAVSIVRERPPGVRKVRSDHNTRRPIPGQGEMPIE